MAAKKAGYILKNKTIIIQRDLTALDLFVKKFIEILRRHTDYLIVSGFVSIATGRTRGTEDVDIIIPIPDRVTFKNFFKDAEKHAFWCYQGDTSNTVYPYLQSFHSIRFALQNELFPNIELIPFDKSKKVKKAKLFEFEHPQEIRIKDFEFKIPPIEFETLYKELVLKSKKDMEDAKHLRTFFSELIKPENFKRYKPIIMSELR